MTCRGAHQNAGQRGGVGDEGGLQYKPLTATWRRLRPAAACASGSSGGAAPRRTRPLPRDPGCPCGGCLYPQACPRVPPAHSVREEQHHRAREAGVIRAAVVHTRRDVHQRIHGDCAQDWRRRGRPERRGEQARHPDRQHCGRQAKHGLAPPPHVITACTSLCARAFINLAVSSAPASRMPGSGMQVGSPLILVPTSSFPGHSAPQPSRPVRSE